MNDRLILCMLEGLFHPAFLARVFSWLFFVVAILIPLIVMNDRGKFAPSLEASRMIKNLKIWTLGKGRLFLLRVWPKIRISMCNLFNLSHKKQTFYRA